MTIDKKILLSGVKPTGRIHVGNYFGAIKQFIDLQEEYTARIMIADLHALTTTQDREKMRGDIMELAIDYLALGLDPEKVILFRQSEVPAHAELAWIFNCITTVPYLKRAHAYKDAEAKKKEIDVGTFTYPMLMAADILLYNPDVVPVGKDQKQHVEYARDTAEKFNRIFGETFKLPEDLILAEMETIPGIDGQKMSKSYNNTIPLFADDEEIKTQVMKIVTDSKNPNEAKDPETDNIFALHKLFSRENLDDIRSRYENGSIGYKESKEILIDNLIKFIAPLKARREVIASDPEKVKAILSEGQEKANVIATEKLKEVKDRVGLLI